MRSSPRRWVSLILAGSLAGVALLVLGGCEVKRPPEKHIDPYVPTTVRAIMTGAVQDTVGRIFNFEIDAPQFEFVHGDVGLMRDGNRLDFFVANDLERLAPQLAGAKLGVKMTFTPAPTHLVLERIRRNGVVVMDSMPRPKGYVLPRVMRSGVNLNTPGAALPSIKWMISESFTEFMPKEPGQPLIAVQSAVEKLVRVPRHNLPAARRAQNLEEDMAWYAVFPDAAVQIVDVTPGADYMLRVLLEKDLPLIGSFTMKTVSDFVDRRPAYPRLGHVVGTLKVNWFRYANIFVEGSNTPD
jgi:hypothetical protein